MTVTTDQAPQMDRSTGPMAGLHPGRRRARGARLLAGLAILMLSAGCQQAPSDAVVALRDFHLTLPQVAAIFEDRFGAGSFDTASVATRERFVRTLADREILLRVARRELPGLTGRQDRQHRVLAEKYLYREMLNYRRAHFQLSPDAMAENLPRIQRMARVRQFTIAKMAVAQAAEQAIRSGVGFDELAKRFADAGTTTARGGASAGGPAKKWAERLVRVDDRRVPPPVVVDALLRDLTPGQVAGPTMTMEGYLVTEVLGYEPIPESSDSVWVNRARHAVEGLAYMNAYQAWLDSLKQAAGYSFHAESYPIARDRFSAFWDSVDALRGSKVEFDFQAVRSPVWRFSAEERSLPLYEFYGTKTLGDYVGGLDSVDLDYWPTRGSLEKVGRQIEARLNRLLLRREALRLGVQHTEPYRKAMEAADERLLLDEFYAAQTRDVEEPTAAEIEAEYNRLRDTLRTPDLISFSALSYPRGGDARVRAALSKLRSGPPLLWLELAPAEAAADTNVKYLPPTELLNTLQPPPDPNWSAFFRAAKSLQAGEISEPLPTPNGGLSLVRVVDRRPPQLMSLAEATPALKANLHQEASDGRIEEILRRDRKRLRLQVFPNRLGGS